MCPGSGSSAGGSGVDSSCSSKKRRKRNVAGVGQRGKENKVGSAAKGVAALFGACSGSGRGGGGVVSDGSGGVEVAKRKDEAPEVISIDDD